MIRRSACAIMVLALLASAGFADAQAACSTASFLPTLAKQPGLSIYTQIFQTLSSSAKTKVPVPADGVTLIAPTDAAFIALLQGTALPAAKAQMLLANKGIALFLYNYLPSGGFSPAALTSAAAAQTGLGAQMGTALPLSFAAARGTVVATGVAGSGALSAPLPVCTSQVYTVKSVLLPATKLAMVPSVAAAALAGAPAEAPAIAPALGPVTAAAAASVPEQAVAAAGPAAATGPAAGPLREVAAPAVAPVAALAPGAAPLAAPPARKKPAAAPAPAPVGSAPAPGVATAPAPGKSTASAPAATAGLTPGGFILAPQGAPTGAPAGAASCSTQTSGATVLLLLLTVAAWF